MRPKGWSFDAYLGLFFFVLVILWALVTILAPPEVTPELQEPISAPIPPDAASQACEVTYGPLPVPRPGWVGFGVVCPEGVVPVGS